MCWIGHIKQFCYFDMSTCKHRMCTIGHNMSSRAHGMSQTWVNLDIPCPREHILCRNVKTYYALTRTWYVHSAFLMLPVPEPVPLTVGSLSSPEAYKSHIEDIVLQYYYRVELRISLMAACGPWCQPPHTKARLKPAGPRRERETFKL